VPWKATELKVTGKDQQARMFFNLKRGVSNRGGVTRLVGETVAEDLQGEALKVV